MDWDDSGEIGGLKKRTIFPSIVLQRLRRQSPQRVKSSTMTCNAARSDDGNLPSGSSPAVAIQVAGDHAFAEKQQTAKPMKPKPESQPKAMGSELLWV